MRWINAHHDYCHCNGDNERINLYRYQAFESQFTRFYGNKRIIDATASRMELDEDKVLVNIHKYGNTTAATLPLLLSDFENKFKKGDNLIFAAFGGGFTWGSIYLKWAYNKQ